MVRSMSTALVLAAAAAISVAPVAAEAGITFAPAFSDNAVLQVIMRGRGSTQQSGLYRRTAKCAHNATPARPLMSVTCPPWPSCLLMCFPGRRGGKAGVTWQSPPR